MSYISVNYCKTCNKKMIYLLQYLPLYIVYSEDFQKKNNNKKIAFNVRVVAMKIV